MIDEFDPSSHPSREWREGSVQRISSQAEGPEGSPRPAADRLVAGWLFLCATLVLGLSLLGGATRLSGSGLSMVDWEPIRGTIPPLTAEAWQEEFAAYRSSPEYRLRNQGLGLDGFRRIFWVEYAHRLLARTVGLAFVVPLVVFGIRRRLSRADLFPLGVLLLLGASQGVVGWLMVRSGLVDRPHVSAYRLAIHLVLGATLFAGLLWLALDRWRVVGAGPSDLRSLKGVSRLFGACLVLLFLSGAFMAGTGAGHAYRTFPLIGGELVPAGLGRLEPWWRNPFENLVAIHLFHRGAALLALISLGAIGWRSKSLFGRLVPDLRFGVLAGVLLLQVALGATTLLLGVPPILAGVHQAGAFAVLGAWVAFHHGLTIEGPTRTSGEVGLH